jgi:hypothetical protein
MIEDDEMEDEKEYFISSICAAKYFNFDCDGKPNGCVLDTEKISEKFDTPEKLWEGFVKDYVKQISIEFAKHLKMKKVKESADKFFENL